MLNKEITQIIKIICKTEIFVLMFHMYRKTGSFENTVDFFWFNMKSCVPLASIPYVLGL